MIAGVRMLLTFYAYAYYVAYPEMRLAAKYMMLKVTAASVQISLGKYTSKRLKRIEHQFS